MKQIFVHGLEQTPDSWTKNHLAHNNRRRQFMLESARTHSGKAIDLPKIFSLNLLD